MKCYNCGNEVIIGDNPDIGICSVCLSEIPLPKGEKSIQEAYSVANELLSQSRFEEAREAFREILIRDTFESAAYWGMATAEYGIEFVQDPATFELLPTLHRLSTERFSEHIYVKRAIEYAVSPAKIQFYKEQSALIDQIQSQSLQISSKEDPYDVFICYKKTEEGEKRTADSRMAADFYKELVRRGYKVFFAEQTLTVGEEYEPRIFAALHSARVLIAIGSRREYYDAVWVKNEWSRYADLIEKETQQGSCDRLLIPFYQNMTPDEMPEVLKNMPKQVDASRLANPRQELLRLISEHFNRNQKEDMSDLRRQVRGQSTGTIRMEESAENDTTRGMVMLIGKDFDQARELFVKALERENWPDAYLGLMMCDLKVAGKDALHGYEHSILEHRYYKKALECAGEEKKKEIMAIGQNCQENYKNRIHREKMQAEGPELAGKIKKRIEKGGLEQEAFGIYKKEMAWAAKAERECRDAEYMVPELAEPLLGFVFLGNLIPSILLLPLNIGDGPSGVSVPAMIGMGLMLIAYFGALGAILKQIEFFDDHKIIRTIVCYFIFMGAATGLYGSHVLPAFVHPLVSIVACVIYYLTMGKKMLHASKVKSAANKTAAAKLKDLPALGKNMRQQALAVYDEERQKYQPYFDEESWKKLVMDGTAMIRDAVDAQVAELQDQLKTL